MVEGVLERGSEYSIIAVQNNALYYGSNWQREARILGVAELNNKNLKIYKAELNTTGVIETSKVRDLNTVRKLSNKLLIEVGQDFKLKFRTNLFINVDYVALLSGAKCMYTE